MRTEYPKITIVTPSYNQGAFIEDTIRSVIEQGYPNLEYIICDGGSTDNTKDIIRKYESHITWWCSEKDNGQTDAINKGMQHATGDIVGWINSDDVLLPGSLFQIKKFFEEHPDCEFMNGTILTEIDKLGIIIKQRHFIMNKFFFKHGCYNINQQGMFWKKSLFNRIGYLDVRFHAKMDVEWLIRVYKNNIKVLSCNLPIGAIRIYGETKTAAGGLIWEKDAQRIKEMYNKEYSFNHSTIYYPLFLICKFLKGCYIKNWVFEKKWIGNHFSAFK